jgi:CRP-like cAMP-binding protein
MRKIQTHLGRVAASAFSALRRGYWPPRAGLPRPLAKVQEKAQGFVTQTRFPIGQRRRAVMHEPDNLHQEHARLIRKLDSIADLSDEERRAIFALPMTVRKFAADQDVVREGDRPSECCLVVEGFAGSYKHSQDGSRQFMAFYVPGDMPDLQSLYLDVMDHSITTLVPSKLAFIPHAALHEVTRRYSGLAAALWRDTLIDAAIFREWIVNVGRRPAYARLAHLLCELIAKLRAVGLMAGSFELPLTQEELGDAMGLSTVHVNRTLQELRANGLIRSEGRTLIVEDWEALKEAGEFDPTYLHLTNRHAA